MGAVAEIREDPQSLAAEVRKGLTAPRKTLPCRFFYDDEGSRLFERICDTPEYYLLRAEHEVLKAHAAELAQKLPAPLTVVELGSGSAVKTRTLLEAFLRKGPVRYVPVDISAAALEQSARDLRAALPSLVVHPVHAEYAEGLRWVATRAEPKLLVWLGSNIGNFDRPDAREFIRSLGAAMHPGDQLLLGVDLRKSPAVLEAAYDDAAGVTAAFNKNLLARLNRELGADFDLAAFRHRARYEEGPGRIVMELVSVRRQSIRLGALGLEVAFQEGESILTECCYKYSPAELHELAEATGLHLEARWEDPDGRFTDALLKRG